MWTKEFIKQVKNLGFKVKEDKGIIGIIADNFIIARVWKNRIYCIDTYNTVKVEWKNEHELFNLLAEYARTPIKDRGDTSKHIYKHNFIKTKGDSFTYLAIRQRPIITLPGLLQLIVGTGFGSFGTMMRNLSDVMMSLELKFI